MPHRHKYVGSCHVDGAAPFTLDRKQRHRSIGSAAGALSARSDNLVLSYRFQAQVQTRQIICPKGEIIPSLGDLLLVQSRSSQGPSLALFSRAAWKPFQSPALEARMPCASFKGRMGTISISGFASEDGMGLWLDRQVPITHYINHGCSPFAKTLEHSSLPSLLSAEHGVGCESRLRAGIVDVGDAEDPKRHGFILTLAGRCGPRFDPPIQRQLQVHERRWVGQLLYPDLEHRVSC
jgi:hypothetical protein